MKKRNKLNLALVIFLLLAAGVIFFVLERNKNNSFEIDRNNPAYNNSKTQNNNPANNNPAENKDNNNIQDIDLSWAIEKYKGKEISKVSTDQKVVALTFDAGANADGVDSILSTLSDNNIKATFFLTGKFIEKYPDKVKKIITNNGDIGSHTYDHPYLTKLTDDQIKDELKKTEDALRKLDMRFKPFLREPYGDRNQDVLNVVSDSGYINIRWTIDSLGWKGTSGGQSKDLVEQNVLKKIAPGSIVLMHLGSNPDDKTQLDSQALPDVIAKLKEDGYQFVTLSQLLETQK